MVNRKLCIWGLVVIVVLNGSAAAVHKSHSDYEVDPHFSYDPLSPRGPPRWKELYPSCGGSAQSPINIESTHDGGRCKPSRHQPIIISNTDYPPKSVAIINDRYTVRFQMAWWKHKLPFVTGGELGHDRYIPRELHLHWGHQNNRGSEHVIDGQQFALEWHIVTFNERYGDVTNATGKVDGILVISQLFYASKISKKYFFNDFIDQVRETGSRVEMVTHLCQFAIDELIQVPAEDWNYVLYPGSFTTPPCHGRVTWMVFLSVQPVSETQLMRLRQLKGLYGRIGDNFRPIQNNSQECRINWD